MSRFFSRDKSNDGQHKSPRGAYRIVVVLDDGKFKATHNKKMTQKSIINIKESVNLLSSFMVMVITMLAIVTGKLWLMCIVIIIERKCY